MGSVTITREKAPWRDRFRAYEVRIDGRRAGALRWGETFSTPLAAGVHSLRLAIDWCGSPEFELDGSLDHIMCCKAGGGAITTVIDIIFRPNKYISLEMV